MVRMVEQTHCFQNLHALTVMCPTYSIILIRCLRGTVPTTPRMILQALQIIGQVFHVVRTQVLSYNAVHNHANAAGITSPARQPFDTLVGTTSLRKVERCLLPTQMAADGREKSCPKPQAYEYSKQTGSIMAIYEAFHLQTFTLHLAFQSLYALPKCPQPTSSSRVNYSSLYQ